MTDNGLYVVVVGGVNIDIGGRSFQPLTAHDSNPGRVSTALGGVGRNIAHNIRLLGLRVCLLTALGTDAHAHIVRQSCDELEIDISRALTVDDCPTSTYLYLNNSNGDMELAVSDMEICDRITPDYLARHLDVIRRAAVVVADTNIPAASLRYLAQHNTSPLFIDPVSTKKAEKLLPILPYIHTIKPNRIEAELLSGVKIRDHSDLHRAADNLLQAGPRQVYISLGDQGVYAAESGRHLLLSAAKAKVQSSTGAGDAFTAALVWAHLNGLDLYGCGRAATAAAAIAVESAATINPLLSPAALRQKIAESKFK